MELLRRLDKSAQQPGTIAGIALGVCGTLMLGLDVYKRQALYPYTACTGRPGTARAGEHGGHPRHPRAVQGRL